MKPDVAMAVSADNIGRIFKSTQSPADVRRFLGFGDDAPYDAMVLYDRPYGGHGGRWMKPENWAEWYWRAKPT